MTDDVHDEQSDREQRIVQELIDEHIYAAQDLVPIDDQTWALHGEIAVDGEVIIAEFDNKPDAESALKQISAGEDNTVTG
jgi:hypothetical protein